MQISRKVLISSILASLFIVCIVYFYLESGTIKEYDRQLGFTEDQETTKIIDSNNEFMNEKTLIAMAIYPDKKEQLLRAKLYVTKRGESAVLQEEDIRETEDLAGYVMRLNNLKWTTGEYTLYFKRGNQLQETLNFSLLK